MHTSNSCPAYIAENGQWSSTMKPYCSCDQKVEKTVAQNLRDLLDAKMKVEGFEMSKKLSSWGLLMNASYDRRIVRSLTDMDKLIKEGFRLEEDAGMFIMNAIRMIP